MRSVFLLPGNPLLYQVCPAVPASAITGAGTTSTIARLYAAATPEQTDHSKRILVGLAAPQIGIQKRIILADIAAEGHGKVGNLRTFINPVIIDHSNTQSEWYEGCYSLPSICGITPRYTTVTIEAYDPNGTKFTRSFEGYTARILQHEIDHLDGKTFADRVVRDDQLHWVEPSEYPAYRDREGWRTWPKKYPRELIRKPTKN